MQNNNRKFLNNTENPTTAGNFEKTMAKNFVDRFDQDKHRYENPVREVEKGTFLGGETRNILTFNELVQDGLIQGQIIEISGNPITKTVTGKFINTDGALADEIVSSNTPPGVDRYEHYYYNDRVLFGEESPRPAPTPSPDPSPDPTHVETGVSLAESNPSQTLSNTNQINTTSDINNLEEEVETEVLDSSEGSKRKREEVEQEPSSKRHCNDNNDDDDPKGSGSGFGGSGSVPGTDGVGGDPTGTSNFRDPLD